MQFNYEKKIYSKKTSDSSLIPKDFEKLPESAKILDVGCGAGGLTQNFLNFKNKKFIIYGIDISKKAISYAKLKYKTIKFMVGSIEKLPFPKNSFDAVTLNCTLEHLDNPQNALQEIRRVLKRNGVFFSITPIEKQHGVFWQDFKLTKKYHGHLTQYDKKSLLRLIKKSGFKIKRYYFTGHFLTQAISGIHLRFLKFINAPLEYSVEDKSSTNYLSIIKKISDLLIKLENMISNPNSIGLYMHIYSQKV